MMLSMVLKKRQGPKAVLRHRTSNVLNIAHPHRLGEMQTVFLGGQLESGRADHEMVTPRPIEIQEHVWCIMGSGFN
ncbi:unnamed protein product [Rhodiola kirilowii]